MNTLATRTSDAPPRRRRWAWGCAVVSLAGMALLVAGSPILLVDLPGGLPVGNPIGAATLVAGAAVPYFASAPGTWLRRVSILALAGALAWLPVSIALAGDLRLLFEEGRGAWWLGYTAVQALLNLALWLWMGGAWAVRRVRG